MRSQSATEYLVTYGWAVVIIAIVLAVMYQFGFFSGNNATPTAQPGTCTVQRLLGQTSLEGQCKGQVPAFAAYFPGSSTQVTTPLSTSGLTQVTVSVWFDFVGYTGNPRLFDSGHTDSPPYNGVQMMVNNGGASGFWNVGNNAGTETIVNWNHQIQTNTWYNMVGTYNGAYASIYLDGVLLQVSAPNTITIESNYDAVMSSYPYAQGQGNTDNIDGFEANVQVYNTSLASTEVSALYLEGIGGAPIRTQNLIGWWPLNGNANDYSGNNHNAQVSNVIFDPYSMWSSAYTAP